MIDNEKEIPKPTGQAFLEVNSSEYILINGEN